MKKNIVFFAALSLLFGACEKDQNTGSDNMQMQKNEMNNQMQPQMQNGKQPNCSRPCKCRSSCPCR